MYDFWPTSPCIEQLIVYSIYSTIGDVLFVLLTTSYEGIISKVAVVTMEMLDMHTMTYLKTILTMTVSFQVMFVMRCMCHCLEKWSTKMTDALYLILVNFPLNWAMNVTLLLIIWSVDTHSSGFVALTIGLLSLWDSVLHIFLSLPPKDTKQMLMAWPWRDAWEDYQILPIKVACQMQDVQDNFNQVSLFVICFKYCLVLHFIG